jgi:hypothetical protein
MKSSILAIILVIILIGSVTTTALALTEYYKANAPETCHEALGVGYIWLPESISNLFMGDNVVLHFSMVNGKNITVYGAIADHGIYDLRCSPLDVEYDADVWMSDETAIYLATSTTPITTFVTNWRNGKIIIETHNQETEEKLSMADELVANDFEPVPISIRIVFGVLLE